MTTSSGTPGCRRWRRPVAGLCVSAVAAVLIAGCGGGGGAGGSAGTCATAPTHPPIKPNGQQLSALSTPGTPKGEQTVPIQVIASTAKVARQALALVPVYINGHGPFPFALDTGATRSLITLPLAQQLHLPSRGSAGLIHGVGGLAQAENVEVARWRAGKVTLPGSIIAAIVPAPGTATSPHASAGNGRVAAGPVGLLGSDVLSRYGKIAIDYDKGLLILDPHVR
jgi:hypothetical protein